ncbi:MAG: efflux RND transporter periplasmic adaptor subunit, partial [Myxococcaceae bacterium]|nr:efflux RND transporter periplasmic adaptor subunit [Myxococcaceae bacterium]
MRTHILLLSSLLAVALAACRREEPPASGVEGRSGSAREEVSADGPAERGDEELITLTPEAVHTAQLQTAQARSGALAGGLSVPARLAFPQEGVAKVAARVPGRLLGIEVELGQKIEPGAVLGYIESPELAQARADFLAAATKARVAGANFERERSLLEKGITSEREMREAESAFVTAQAERNAADSRLHTLGLSEPEIQALRRGDHHASRFPLRSPIAGTVVEVLATPGQTVESATPLFTVGDLSTLWALLDVPESQISRLRIGQQVELSVTGVPERRFVGRVDYIGDIVEEKTRTIPVRVVVPNEVRVLKAGMFASALVATGPEADAGDATGPRVVVPREAVQTVGSEQVVFVPEGPNHFRPVAVQVGATSAAEA